MANTIQIKRRVSGAAGAPATLKSGELSYNMSDGKLYVGFGDDGSGNATSVKAFAMDNFITNIPTGGTTNQVLAKASNTNGDVAWTTVNTGSTYTASGDGIELTGTNFALNYSEIDTGLTLTSRLAAKAPIDNPTFTGKVITAASAAGGAGFNLPHGAAPSAPVNGDLWSTTADLLVRINGATKTVAFTDSNITGSAATLTTPRAISISGGGITATGVNFDGSAAISLSASVDNDHVNNARLANMPANTLKGNNTGVSADPADLTTTQVKTLLDIRPADIGAGTFTTAQIPDLAASKITSGTFDAARIPDLDAAKIISGTIDPARLPVLPSSVQIVSTGGIAALDAGQQASIGDGSVVTTTDGRRWVYTGSGSKTAEASYIELADITPEWSVVANKPANVTSLAGLAGTAGSAFYFSGVNTLSEYATTAFGRGLANLADASALRTAAGLGTMATQNANAVAITGGTIDGVTLDGGTF